jgi:hypothetical protein
MNFGVFQVLELHPEVAEIGANFFEAAQLQSAHLVRKIVHKNYKHLQDSASFLKLLLAVESFNNYLPAFASFGSCTECTLIQHFYKMF